MENTDLFFCCNCKYWTQFERRDVQTRLGWCNKDRQRVSISAKQDFCSSFAFNNPAPPTVADAERLSDHQLGELCRLLRDRLNFQEAINRLSEGCAFYSRKIDEQETTIARLTIERDRAREVAERQAAEISIQSDQLLMMSEHLNESSKQRDTTRAQVNDLSAEVVKMTEEIRQLRGMIH